MPTAARIGQVEVTVLTPVPVARIFVPESIRDEPQTDIKAMLARLSLDVKWEWEYDPMRHGYNVTGWAKLTYVTEKRDTSLKAGP